MGFPIDFTLRVGAGETLRAAGAQDRFLGSIAAQLRARKARDIRIERSRLEFKGPYLFFTSGWNKLVMISNGRIDLLPAEAGVTIEYWMSIKWMALVVLVQYSIFAVIIASTLRKDALIALPAFTVMLAVFIGIRVAATLGWFRSLLLEQLDVLQP